MSGSYFTLQRLQTPLHVAVESGFQDVVEVLLASNASLTAKEKVELCEQTESLQTWQFLWWFVYRKFPQYSDTQKICCIHSKIWTVWLYYRVMSSNDADGMANSVDPDQEQSDLGLHCLPRHICPKT